MSCGVLSVIPHTEAIVSNSLDQLFASLLDGIEATPREPLLRARIVVPEHSLRAWLCHKLAGHNISLLRVEVLPTAEALSESPSRASLLPLLVAFLESQNAPSTPKERYRLAKRLLLPFALRTFLGDGRALTSYPDGEELWKKFEQWKGHSCNPQSLSTAPLFLFGFSSLHPQLVRYFLSMPHLRAFYLLSPCMLFWGDQSSDHEAKWLLSPDNSSRPSVEQLEAFLDDRHKLLANSGQVGREFLSAIEDTSVQTRSQYVFPENLLQDLYSDFLLPETLFISKEGPPSLLEYLKADLLTLVSKRSKPCDLPNDRSIEVHAAPTVLREVEALYERLSVLKELLPASVLVLVTDLRQYTAAIEQVFGKEIPYQVWGETNPSGAIAAWRMLISLLQSKGTLTEWIQLLRHPVFQRAVDLSGDESEDLIDWLHTRPIQWGLSSAHKERYLKQRAIPYANGASRSSFADERELLVASLLSTSTENAAPVSLLPAIGAFLHVLQRIEAWWPLPLDPASFVPLADMSSLLNETVSFLADSDSGGFEEEALRSAAASLSSIAQQTSSPQLPVSEALKIFERSALAHLNASAFSLRAPVIVAEFGSFQPFPVKLIAILGANAGILPQYDEERLFDRLDRLAATLPASNTFVDRYSFLESILCADSLFIGYQSYAFDLKEALQPSPIVNDLFIHLDQQYRIDGAVPSGALFISHSLSRPRRPAYTIEPSEPLYLEKRPSTQVVDLKQIEWAVRSPLHLFFTNQFALTSPKKTTASLFPSPWGIQDQVRSALRCPTSEAKESPFLEKAQRELSEALNVLSLPSLTCYDLHLLPTVTAPYTSSSSIFSPIISGPVEVFGSWPGLIGEGVLLLSDNWKRELFTRWPECSVRAYCAQELGLPFPHQAIVVSKKELFTLPTPPKLQEWAEFTHHARTMAFPFTFEIVKLMLENPSVESLLQAIEESAKEEPIGGSMSLYLNTVSPESCAKDLPTLERYATLLWSSLFSALEAP